MNSLHEIFFYSAIHLVSAQKINAEVGLFENNQPSGHTRSPE